VEQNYNNVTGVAKSTELNKKKKKEKKDKQIRFNGKRIKLHYFKITKNLIRHHQYVKQKCRKENYVQRVMKNDNSLEIVLYSNNCSRQKKQIYNENVPICCTTIENQINVYFYLFYQESHTK
jgi:hypothetical protein